MKYNQASMHHVITEMIENKKENINNNLDLDKNIINFKTEIELKNVSFTYENNKKDT